MYFTDAIEYYIEKGVEFEEGLQILLNVNYDKGAGYENKKIIMDGYYASPEHPFSPYTHYHEFSHYVMHTMYGDVYDQIVKEKNHGGFANPSTSDSWAEGFAAFMPTQIAEHVDYYWATKPSQRNPANYPPAGSLDIDYKAWEMEGKAEEYAIAGVLWDMVDDSGMKGTALSGADIAFALYIGQADLDGNKIIDKEEYAFHQFYESGASIEMDYGDWYSMIGFGITLENAFDVEADMTIFDKYKGDDEELSGSELIEMADIMKYEHKSDIVKDWLSYYDKDENGIVSKTEVKNILREYEIIKIVSKGEETVDEDQWKKYAKDKKIQDGVWVFEGDTITFEEYTKKLKDLAISDDDDKLAMDFDELWGMMSTPHVDFFHFLEEVVTGRDDTFGDNILDIFIEHGIYIDKTKGNKKYDEGEAYIDSNNDGKYQESEVFIDYPLAWVFDDDDDIGVPSNYERLDRTTTPKFPGYEVVGADQVSYIVWEKGQIRHAFTIPTDGYVPVPSNAQIIASSDNDEFSFSSIAFVHDYEDIKAQGHIAKIKPSDKKKSKITENKPINWWPYLGVALVIVVVIQQKKKKK